MSAPVNVNVTNTSYFRNEILATGFDLPTAIEFLPDGRMLVVELAGKIKVLPPPYTQPDPTPFLQLTNIGSPACSRGSTTSCSIPNFTTNHYYYVFYTLGTPNRDRVSRFTANATLTGTVAGSEFVLYQDPQDAERRAPWRRDRTSATTASCYFTTGEHSTPRVAQTLTNPRGKIHRINPDGTVPTDNPFYDGAGPNYDSIWALGLRNPFRAYYDAPTGRLFIGDVGGNDYSTAIEEIDIGAPGRQLRLAQRRRPDCTAPTRVRSTPSRTTVATRPSRADSSITAPVPEPAIRAATSSPTTRRTGSSA